MDLYNRWFHEATGEAQVWPSAGGYRTAVFDASRFERGWRIVATVGTAPGACLVMRGGRERVVSPPEMIPEDPRALWLARGVAVRVPAVTCGESGGFWHLWSAGWRDAAPERVERFYFRVRVHEAAALARRLLDAAPSRAVWCMKLLCGTHDAGRRDHALLYVPAGSREGAGWVASLLAGAADVCDGTLPPFVAPLAHGIGWARDPGGNRSFGQAVCAAVASAAPYARDAGAFAQAARAAVGDLQARLAPIRVERA